MFRQIRVNGIHTYPHYTIIIILPTAKWGNTFLPAAEKGAGKLAFCFILFQEYKNRLPRETV